MKLSVVTDSGVVELGAGEKLFVSRGETIRVLYSFEYRYPEPLDTQIKAALFTRTWYGSVHPVGEALNRKTITLDAAPDWTGYSGEIDIALGAIDGGVYGLMVELAEFGEGVYEDNVIEVEAAPGITDLIGPMLMIAMMAMMVPMAQGMAEGME